MAISERTRDRTLDGFAAPPESASGATVAVGVPIGQLEVLVDVPCTDADATDVSRSPAQFQTRATEDVRVRLSPGFGVPDRVAPEIAWVWEYDGWRYDDPVVRGYGGAGSVHRPAIRDGELGVACDIHNLPDEVRLDDREITAFSSWSDCRRCYGGESGDD